MSFSFILLSAGRGKRLGNAIPKQYLSLGGKPIIVHTLERIEKIDEIKEVLLVCNQEDVIILKKYIYQYRLKKNIVFVQGGDTRQASVYEGVKMAKYDTVLIHEAARPFVSVEDFLAIIHDGHENVTYSYPIPYTVLRKNEQQILTDLLNRDELVNIQLPQKFNKNDLLKCHELASAESKMFTEDSGMLLYYLKKPVYCLRGKSTNIKITEHIDLLFGETIFKEEFCRE